MSTIEQEIEKILCRPYHWASTLRWRIANCELKLDQMARDQVRLKQMVNEYRVELRGLEGVK